MTAQNAFTAALLDPELPCPMGLSAWNGSDPAQRFRVYRNNVIISLVDALADSSVNLAVRPWVENGDYWTVFFDLQEKLCLLARLYII